MYRAFNLQKFQWNTDWNGKGNQLLKESSIVVRDGLGVFVSSGKINGSQLRDHWFPEIEADVFISHSHDDLEVALNFAGWLSAQFGLSSFIDSCVWGYADDLLRKIDERLCWKPESKTFSYEKRNGSTSHVHMMLATAISRMIDAAECVFFVSTPNSVTAEESVQKVSSPWIFYELALMEIIRKRPLSDYRSHLVKKSEEQIDLSEGVQKLPIEYDASFSSLTSVDSSILKSWRQNWLRNTDSNLTALDILYELVPYEKLIL